MWYFPNIELEVSQHHWSNIFEVQGLLITAALKRKMIFFVFKRKGIISFRFCSKDHMHWVQANVACINLINGCTAALCCSWVCQGISLYCFFFWDCLLVSHYFLIVLPLVVLISFFLCGAHIRPSKCALWRFFFLLHLWNFYIRLQYLN